MTLLLLGGTADARQMATRLYEYGIPVKYSIAGLVRRPDIPCEIISGGFGGKGGLTDYIVRHNISVVLDATHPYAEKISETAVCAADLNKIPCVRFLRPAWERQNGDNWTHCRDWKEIIQNLIPFKRPFFTAGQLSQEVISALQAYQVALVRTAVAHKTPLLDNCRWLKGIGPFTLQDERRIMEGHRIDVVVSKNSGGEATIAKLQAAKHLGIPVLMLERPCLQPASIEFSEPESCVNHCAGLFNNGRVLL